ncbi:MAG TPA: hypothetical protein VG916_02085, partial [Gemmatimonadaceae bacterium]|nr:hypothetical protein [Gemmatimonadaceae bacterium]
MPSPTGGSGHPADTTPAAAPGGAAAPTRDSSASRTNRARSEAQQAPGLANALGGGQAPPTTVNFVLANGSLDANNVMDPARGTWTFQQDSSGAWTLTTNGVAANARNTFQTFKLAERARTADRIVVKHPNNGERTTLLGYRLATAVDSFEIDLKARAVRMFGSDTLRGTIPIFRATP